MPLTHTLDIAELVDLLPDIVCAVGEDGTFLYVSAACEAVLGYRREELQGRLMLDFIHPEDRAATLEVARTVIAGQPLLNFENRYLRKDGSVVHLLWTARWSERKQVRIAVAHDISAGKRKEVLHRTLYHLTEAVHATPDIDALYQEIHAGLAALLPVDSCCVALLHKEDDTLAFPFVADSVAARGGDAGTPAATAAETDRGASRSLAPLTGQLCRAVIRRGEPLLLNDDTRAALVQALKLQLPPGLVSWLGVPLRSDSGVAGVLAVQTWDGTPGYTTGDQQLLQFLSSQVAIAIERKHHYQRHAFLSLHDPLTGLPNRRLFEDRLAGAVERSRRQGTRFAVLFLDLDDFKLVNDQFGHEAGDKLLCQVAQRLLDSVRRSDTVARLGGDEFVLLLECLEDGDTAVQLRNKLRKAFVPTFSIDGRQLSLGVSIGVAVYPDHGEDHTRLLAHADRDMYRVKAVD